jgi:hypothetical protein
MYGAQIEKIAKRKHRAMMRLRGKYSDASRRNLGLKAFSEYVVPLVGGARSQARHMAQVARVTQHQWRAPRIVAGALTSCSSGSANTPLRYAFAAH